MELRQPSKIATFFAQSKAGAEQQQKAREKLQKPQALGGSAAAGTQMIASQTQAQQGATQQVKQTTEDVSKNLNVNPENVQSSTAMAIAGKGTGTSGQYNYTTGPGGERVYYEGFQGGISGPQTFSQVDPNALSRSTNIDYLNTVNTDTQSQLSKIQADLKLINDQIANANAEDAKKLQAEKERLEKLFTEYNDKLTKENLGQVAGLSDTALAMEQREKLLASEGQRVAKLASIFGPGWNAGRYGGLASQIYGKDLEAIQEAAGVGLEAKEKAGRESDFALERYKGQLDESQKKVAESLKKEQDKLDILKKTPEELKGTTKEDLVKLFGNLGLVQSLFEFDNNGKVVGTKVSTVKNAYTREESKLKDILSKMPDTKKMEQDKADKEFKTIDEEMFGTDQKEGTIQKSRGVIKNFAGNANKYRIALNNAGSGIFGGRWEGYSKDSATVDIMDSKISDFNTQAQILSEKMESARKNKETKNLLIYKQQFSDLYTKTFKELEKLENTLSGQVKYESNK